MNEKVLSAIPFFVAGFLLGFDGYTTKNGWNLNVFLGLFGISISYGEVDEE